MQSNEYRSVRLMRARNGEEYYRIKYYPVPSYEGQHRYHKMDEIAPSEEFKKKFAEACSDLSQNSAGFLTILESPEATAESLNACLFAIRPFTTPISAILSYASISAIQCLFSKLAPHHKAAILALPEDIAIKAIFRRKQPQAILSVIFKGLDPIYREVRDAKDRLVEMIIASSNRSEEDMSDILEIIEILMRNATSSHQLRGLLLSKSPKFGHLLEYLINQCSKNQLLLLQLIKMMKKIELDNCGEFLDYYRLVVESLSNYPRSFLAFFRERELFSKDSSTTRITQNPTPYILYNFLNRAIHDSEITVDDILFVFSKLPTNRLKEILESSYGPEVLSAIIGAKDLNLSRALLSLFAKCHGYQHALDRKFNNKTPRELASEKKLDVSDTAELQYLIGERSIFLRLIVIWQIEFAKASTIILKVD